LIRVLPGAGPVEILNLKLPPDRVALINKELGLDKSLFDQYILYLTNIFINFDFGTSFATNTPIVDELIPRFMATIELSILASIIGIPLGIYIGTYSGRHRGTNKDNAIRIYTIAVYSIPIFWLGIWMQVIFAKIMKNTAGGLLGYLPANTRTSDQIIPYIHNVTGIYFIDSLLFTGPDGWQNIYYLFIIIVFLTLLVSYLYLSKIKNFDVEKDKIYLLIFSFIISEICLGSIFSLELNVFSGLLAILSISIIVGFLYFLKSVNAKENKNNILYIGALIAFIEFSLIITNYVFIDLLISLFGYYEFFLKAFLFLIAFSVWIFFYNGFHPKFKGYFKKMYLIAFLLCFIPLIPYFMDSWFVVKTPVNNHEVSYTAITLFEDVFRHLILPSITLGLLISGVVARLVRTNMVTVMFEQFIDSSKSRGISEKKITYDYGLKNATVPAIPLIGLQFAILLGGAILTETTYSYVGLGLYLFSALSSKDYPAIQASIILFSICVAIVSFLSDIIYATMDKRVRL
jgi:ABC-type dipeptide/oligopeptide/nickel transport system permease component